MAARASAEDTTKEMLRSDEPCAIATTLMPPAASAENTRAEMPGVPTMPSPTTAITATGARALTPSIRPCAISTLNARRNRATARSASAAGSVKPIELSDEAWKIVETESCSASTAAKARAAMPCTPAMPLPATVITA